VNGAAQAALDEQGCRQIHEAALKLLGEVGCAVLDEEARELLKAHGARVDGHVVRFDEALVEQARATAPSGFTVAGRRPDLDLRVALDAPPVLASASGPPFVLVDGEYRPGTLADLRTAIALAHLSPNVQVVAYALEPNDAPEETRAKVVAHAHVTGTDKSARYTITTPEELRVALDVHEILWGADWHEQPRVFTVINTTSPLQFSADGARGLLRLARLGQPVLVAVCAMGGTTAPITLAGLLAVQHAELLVGLVLTQLARPGAPFIYGGTSSLSSMQTGALMMGAPEYWTLMEATVRLGHWLGVPVRAGGAITDAHVPDAQAGIESALALEAVLRTGAQYILHAGGILSSFNCYSPEKFVIDDEILTALRTAKQPIRIDEDQLALDVTAAAGPGGTVLGSGHTRRHAREQRRGGLMNRLAFETWQAQGSKDLAAAAATRVRQLLDSYEPPDDLDPVVRRQLDTYCLG
jgi:trimethylamine---corrinoid protein Co-methyltransferase